MEISVFNPQGHQMHFTMTANIKNNTHFLANHLVSENKATNALAEIKVAQVLHIYYLLYTHCIQIKEIWHSLHAKLLFFMCNFTFCSFYVLACVLN